MSVINRRAQIMSTQLEKSGLNGILARTKNSASYFDSEMLALKASIHELSDESTAYCKALERRLHAANVELHQQKAENKTSRRELEKVKFHALYDCLTKLPNRRLFGDRFDQSILFNRRNKTSIALLFIDVDQFKVINDTYGHLGGDYLLMEYAKRIKNTLRECDTLARFGGDEFAILLTNLPDTCAEAVQSTSLVANKIRECVGVPVDIAHRINGIRISAHCTVSIGGVVLDAASIRQNKNLESMLSRADKCMYQAKDAGGNKAQIISYSR